LEMNFKGTQIKSKKKHEGGEKKRHGRGGAVKQRKLGNKSYRKQKEHEMCLFWAGETRKKIIIRKGNRKGG